MSNDHAPEYVSKHLILNAGLTVAGLLLLKWDGPGILDYVVAGYFGIAAVSCVLSRSAARTGGVRFLLLAFMALNIAAASVAIWIANAPDQEPAEEGEAVAAFGSLLKTRSRIQCSSHHSIG